MQPIKRPYIRNKMSDTGYTLNNKLSAILWICDRVSTSHRHVVAKDVRALYGGDKTRTSFSVEGAVYPAFRDPAVAFERPRLPHFWAAARCVVPFIIPPSLRHYRIILFHPRIFPPSTIRLSTPPSLPRNSIPVPACPLHPPSTFLRYRLSISRSTAVTFKRNLHNGVVWKSVFSAGTIAIVSGK